LEAADALWQSGGEEAVTIRGVATEAAITTPTVYSRYADREALPAELRALAFQRFLTYLQKSRDFQDACARHLEFGTSHPRDYEVVRARLDGGGHSRCIAGRDRMQSSAPRTGW
jgi:AcrR family transcriptional regulator